MSTRVFKVQYWVTEYAAGQKQTEYTASRSVVAKDAQEAINKVKTLALEPDSFTSQESGKKVKVTFEKCLPKKSRK